MAAEVVDCHVHVACPGAPLVGQAVDLNATHWWDGGGGDEPSLRAALDASGVAAAVVVQAVGPYAFDCRCAAEVVANGGERYALVGAVDMMGPDPAADLEALAGDAPIVGIRMVGITGQGAPWLWDGRGAAICDVAESLGLCAVFTIYGGDLPALLALVGRRSGLVTALDHCGYPDLGPPEAMGHLLALGQLPSVHLKVTSRNLDGPGDPAAFIEPLVEAFGPDRLCWGSNYPQQPSLTYPEIVALARRAVRHLSAEDQTAFLGGNSRRLWWEGAKDERDG